MITEAMQERVALGPEPGQDFKLIEVVSTKGPANMALGTSTARSMIKAKFHVADHDILSVEFAGRGVHGDPVYLVTWRIPNADVPPGVDESSPEWQALQQGLMDESVDKE